MEGLFIHSISIEGTPVNDTKLPFTTGTATFTVGKTVTGGTSHKTGVIKSLTLSTGSWGGGTAAGYLVLHTVSGTFQSGETITDNGTVPGSAKAGTPTTNSDEYGVPTVTYTTTTAKCRFTPASPMVDNASGERIIGKPKITVLPSISVSVGNRITFDGTVYRVTSTHYAYDGTGHHHTVCELETVS